MSDAHDFAILIEADDVFEDFDRRGWRHSLYIDAEAREVSTWSAIGGGMPFAVFHRRALMIEIPDGVTGRHLAQWCEEHRAEIGALLSLYAGCSWDGHNMVGGWHEGVDGHECVLRDLLHDADLPKVWPASEWFTHETPWEAVERARDNRQVVIDEIIAAAESDGGLLWRADVGRYLDERIEELNERAETILRAAVEAFNEDVEEWAEECCASGVGLVSCYQDAVAECEWADEWIRERLIFEDVPDALDSEIALFRKHYIEAMETWIDDLGSYRRNDRGVQ